MRNAHCYLLALLPLAFLIGCRSAPVVAPLILYGSTPKPPGEISVIQVVKTHPERGHPTIDIRAIYRLTDPQGAVFRIQQGRFWAPPGHFGGLPSTQRAAPAGDLRNLPHRFELLPGTYRVLYRYVPTLDRFGWRHTPTGQSSTILECRAGFVYLLEGHLEEKVDRWYLTAIEERGQPTPGTGEAGRP